MTKKKTRIDYLKPNLHVAIFQQIVAKDYFCICAIQKNIRKLLNVRVVSVRLQFFRTNPMNLQSPLSTEWKRIFKKKNAAWGK